MRVTELRKGALFVENGNPWKVLQYTHIKMGRGGANIKVKAVDLKTGKIREFTYNSGGKVQDADVEVVKTTLRYRTGKDAHFADGTVLPIELIKEKIDFLKGGSSVGIVFFEGEAIDLAIPLSVELKVKKTNPAVAGNTAGNATKEALLESGLRLQVPLFINEGDVVKVNTESGEYVTRV